MTKDKISLIIGTLLCSIIFVPEGTSNNIQHHYTTNHNPFQEAEDISALRCGGIVNITNGEFTSLSYNHMSPVQPNERCVWVVEAPSNMVNNFQVNILAVGYEQPNDNHMLIISCFRSNPWYENTFHVATSESSTLALTGSVLVITLVTGRDLPEGKESANGFSLSITSGFDQELPGNSGPHHVLDSSTGALNYYPPGRYPVSAFVFVPFNNTHTEGSRTDVFFTSRSRYYQTPQECQDLLQVFRFKVSSPLPHKWEDMGSICVNTNPDVITFSNSDLLLLVFRGDSQNGIDESGFNIAYSRCSS